MRYRIESKLTTHGLSAIACVCLTALSTFAADGPSRVMLKPDVSRSHRDELVSRLRAITGLPHLRFDDSGSLRFDNAEPLRGSESARLLLSQAIAGANFIILEDASSRSDVAFCRVVRGRWVDNDATKPPAYVRS